MSLVERFWWALTMAAVAWYAAIALCVAVRGAGDIRSMLRRIADRGR